MEITKIKAIHGPGIFHNRPVIISRLNLKNLAETGTHQIPDFVSRLLSLFPGMVEHTCSPGYRGGFIERLNRGTYLAHVTEHVAIELSELAGIGVTYGKTVYAGSPGLYDVVTCFENEEGMMACHRLAVEVVSKLLEGQLFELASSLSVIKSTVARTKMGPSTQAIYDAAVDRGIPCRRVSENSLLRLGYGKNIRHVQAAVTDRTSNIAVELVQDKSLTKNILIAGGVPVPAGSLVYSITELLDGLSEIKFPIAIKPYDGHHGEGVCLNVNSIQEATFAFQLARKFSDGILIEEMCPGKDYRVLMVDGKMVAAAERIPPFVTGDNVSTIGKLIEVLNEDSRRVEGHGGALTKIEIDEMLLKTLQKQNQSLEIIPKFDEKIYLRENANLSGGGTARDVTDDVHPSVKAMCERATCLVGLDICGVDLIHSDISKPVEDGAKVIEVNAGPGLRMHLAPNEGMPRQVGKDIVRMLYPKGDSSSSRIPIVGVTGTNGKTSSVRMLAKVLSAKFDCVGMTSSDGVWIGDHKIDHGDTSGPLSAAKVLNDPQVDCAVLELARGGIMRGGLAYDWSDIGIITNIRPDHIGQDGIEDMEDLVRIKSLVVERVRLGGTIVLNADDKNAMSLLAHRSVTNLKRNIMLYSVKDANLSIHRHLHSAQDACWVEEGIVHCSVSGKLETLGQVSDLPVTMGGLAEFQISNSLAVICGAVGLGMRPQEVFEKLKTFNPAQENIGRLNIYVVRENYVVLDYGHNPDAFVAIGKMLENYRFYKTTAVVGLPGDRRDELLEQGVRSFAPYFDKVIIKEDQDLRGRKVGEIPLLMASIIEREFPHIECQVIPREDVAIELALSTMQQKEIVVIFYDQLETSLKIIRNFDPTPVHFIPHMPGPVKQPGINQTSAYAAKDNTSSSGQVFNSIGYK